MFGFDFWFTAAVVVLMTAFLILELIEADIVVFSALIVLVLGGVIDINDAFQGFSNQGMLTVAFLFVVAAALQKTRVLDRFGEILLGGKEGSISGKLLRFLPPVAGVSAFMNNTPLVAILIPVVRNWTKKHHLPISKFLIPLSYATILGGTCTLIGTSTNLVVHGLMLENNLKGFGFLDLAPVGLTITVVGLLYISLIGHKLLPDRKEPTVSLGEQTREFVVVMKVIEGYQHQGKTVEQAGLRHLKGLFLFQIERDGQRINPARPDDQIELHDRLFFTGLPDTIMELQKTPGLLLLKDAVFDLKNYDSDALTTFEVVVSQNSPLVGQNVRDSDFRGVYDAVIVAIHRSGERIHQKIGDIVMRSGDTLLILARHSFMERWYHSRDFYLVSRSVDMPSKPRWYSFFSLAVLLSMIGIMVSGLLPILLIVCIAAGILLISRCITANDARNSIDWKVLLVIASSFGIAQAIDKSGVAHFLAYQLIRNLGSFGTLGILAGVYFTTSFYTEIITNNAAAAMLFPIALSVASQVGVHPMPFLVAVTIGASATFSTPIGYQTNLMVYGPGGYRFRDFLKVGIPMNLLVGMAATLAIYFFYM